jgi:hypothetical protein
MNNRRSNHHIQRALRRGESLLAPTQPRKSDAIILRWTPARNEAGTVLGFFDLRLPSGMTILSCRLMMGPRGVPWVATPAVKQAHKDGTPRVDPAGKQLWQPVVDFAGRAARDRFNGLALEALRRDHPDAFDDGEQP